MSALYEFKEQDAEDFARRRGAYTKNVGDEIQFKFCPYCNGGSKHDSFTFAINRKTGAFNCKRNSCGVQGNMITLARDFDFSLGRVVDEYYAPKKKYKSYPRPTEPIIPKSAAVEYFEKRGISEETLKKYSITTKTDSDNIVCFPFFDEEGEIRFIKYRKTDFDKTKDTCKEWSDTGGKPILYGMYQCEDFGRLVITEGQIDSLSLAECGIKNAVSVPTGANGFTWIPYCWNWMNRFNQIVVFGDFERGAMSLLEELTKRFKSKVKHVRYNDYIDCKDANEILKKYGKEYLISCVDNAESAPIKQLIRPKDVKTISPYKIPKIRTGIGVLDKALYGGIPKGGVTILAGKTGEGKSTLGSLIIASALDEGESCFIYSGELTNSLVKDCLYRQLAGKNRLQAYVNCYGDTEYTLSDTNTSLIDNEYNDRLLIYDNSLNNYDEEERMTLIELMEASYSQYGTEVFLLDNLMTAIAMQKGLKGGSEFEIQSDFANKLSKFAVKYQVAVILVAHKKKSNGFETDNNESVKGSSDVTNLGALTISYDTNLVENEEKKMLKISKNRLFGKLNKKGWEMRYDEASKRIASPTDNFNRRYSWDKDFEQLKINDETPFD